MFGNRRKSADDTIRQHKRHSLRVHAGADLFADCRLVALSAQPVSRRQTVDGGRRTGEASVGRSEPTRRIIDLRSRGCGARRHVIIQ